MSIRSYRSVQPASDTPAFIFSINGQTLSFVDSHKHLGVILTADSEWKVTAREVISKGTKKSWVAEVDGARIALFSGDKLYLCYVRPSLEYAAPVWHGSILENDAVKLERIQCSVARSLLKAEWTTPKETLLRSLNWPSLRWRCEVHAMLLFLDLLKGRPLLCLSVSIPSLTASRIAPSVNLTSFFFFLLIPINLSSSFFIDPLYRGTLCRTQYK